MDIQLITLDVCFVTWCLIKGKYGRWFRDWGYYVNTVSQYGGERTIQRYIQNQGKNDKTYNSKYKQLYENKSNDLFEPLTES